MCTPSWTRAAAVLAVTGVLACSQEGPAQDAIATADSAIAAAPADAQAYAPEMLATATTAIGDARAAFAQQDWETAQAKAAEAATAIEGLPAAIDARKSELTTEWNALSQEVPTAIASAKARVGELTRARRLPAGITRNAVTAAAATVTELEAAWAEAAAAFTAGQLVDAVTKANGCKTGAAGVMAALGGPSA